MDEIASSKGNESGLATIELPENWNWELLTAAAHKPAFAAALARAIVTRRWYGAKSRAIVALGIAEAIAIGPEARLLLVAIEFSEGLREVYQVPLAVAADEKAERLLADSPLAVWARVRLPDHGRTAVLYDPLADAGFCRTMLGWVESQATLVGAAGELVAWQAGPFKKLRGDTNQALEPQIVSAEQSNSSIAFGGRLILKIFRRIETGLNPDLEMAAFLTGRGFAHVAPLAGAIEYRRAGQEPWTLGVVQAFVANQGDAWRHTLAGLEAFLRDKLASRFELPAELRPAADGLSGAARRPLPPAARSTFGDAVAEVELLGTRTAEMHLALASDSANAAFAPEPFSPGEWRSSCQRAGELARDTFRLLREQMPRLQGDAANRAAKLLALAGVAGERFRHVASMPPRAAKIRCHGDYHLGQVLVAGGDFVIIDFEGEPARPLAERREKQLALVDAAGMIRSFHYASCSAASDTKASWQADAGRIDGLAHAWYSWMSAAFLAAYRRTAAGAVFVPQLDADFDRLLEACLLRKALYELRYELNNRPAWVYLPLAALEELCCDKTGQV